MAEARPRDTSPLASPSCDALPRRPHGRGSRGARDRPSPGSALAGPLTFPVQSPAPSASPAACISCSNATRAVRNRPSGETEAKDHERAGGKAGGQQGGSRGSRQDAARDGPARHRRGAERKDEKKGGQREASRGAADPRRGRHRASSGLRFEKTRRRGRRGGARPLSPEPHQAAPARAAHAGQRETGWRAETQPAAFRATSEEPRSRDRVAPGDSDPPVRASMCGGSRPQVTGLTSPAVGRPLCALKPPARPRSLRPSGQG